MSTFNQFRDEIINEGHQLALKQLCAYVVVGKVH